MELIEPTLSNNLFSSMINTGKMIAEKLKNNIGKE